MSISAHFTTHHLKTRCMLSNNNKLFLGGQYYWPVQKRPGTSEVASNMISMRKQLCSSTAKRVQLMLFRQSLDR